MFRLRPKPWNGDPEVDAVHCEQSLREFLSALTEDADALPDWAVTLAGIATERAAALGVTTERYLRGEDGTAPDLRAEAAQLDRDATIAAKMEAATDDDGSRQRMHVLALCVAHLSDVGLLRLALVKLDSADAPASSRLRIVYDTAVEVSERLVALATLPDGPARAAAVQDLHDWLSGLHRGM